MFFASQNPEYITQLLVADIAPKAYPAHHQQILKGLASLDFSILKSRTQADQELSNFCSGSRSSSIFIKKPVLDKKRTVRS